MMCQQSVKLLRDSNEAALEFSKMLVHLLQAQQTTSGAADDYNSLRKSVELTRTKSTFTRQALEDHLHEHGCETSIRGVSRVARDSSASKHAPAA
jgi:hypothetical protein